MSRPSSSSSGSGGPTSRPRASIGRMILSPLLRLLRRLNIPLPTNLPTSPSHLITPLTHGIQIAFTRFDRSLSPRDTFARIAAHQWSISNTLPLIFLAVDSIFMLWMMTSPSFPLKLFIPLLYALTLLFPISNQFFWPATPVLVWVLTFFSARFIPANHRPTIHVALLPALESVLYGANISDLQTRFTHPFLDVLAWLPYGVLHFGMPVVVAFCLWALAPRGAIQYWGKAFGWMNLLGVLTQLVFPCAAPWYEIIHGLTPASYSMSGSPGGLMRIDKVFHSHGYAETFGHSPMVFGAFPSLHSGCAVMEALFLSHFFPSGKIFYWTYTGILWWATMYLSHHYLIDLVGGACFSVVVFYLTMPEGFKDSDSGDIKWAPGGGAEGYEMVGTRQSTEEEDEELDLDEEIRKLEESDGLQKGEDVELGGAGSASGGGRGEDIGEGKRKKSVSWGQTEIMKGNTPRPSSE